MYDLNVTPEAVVPPDVVIQRSTFEDDSGAFEFELLDANDQVVPMIVDVQPFG